MAKIIFSLRGGNFLPLLAYFFTLELDVRSHITTGLERFNTGFDNIDMASLAIPLLSLSMAVLSAGYAWISETEIQLLYSAALTVLFCVVTTAVLVASLRVATISPVTRKAPQPGLTDPLPREISIPKVEPELLPLHEMGTLNLFEDRSQKTSSIKKVEKKDSGSILGEVSSFLEGR